jgi:acetyl-CoA carboxylase biotin carboxyl carrier protein
VLSSGATPEGVGLCALLERGRTSGGPGLGPLEAGKLTMDLETLREVIALLKQHGLAEIDLEEDGRRLRVVAPPEPAAPAFIPIFGANAPASAPPAAPTSSPAPATAPDPAAEPPRGPTINSPIVGTFYRAPSPDSPPYIEDGDEFDEETVLCIVEAMKVMNEIKAETKGRLIEALVENGQPVEFGQPLFRIETSG